jgi:hypothetical protein
MKATIPFIIAASVAACAFCISPAIAKDKKSPAPAATASATATNKTPRPIPYRGRIASVDTSANTFTVGKRTFKVTDQTKITKQEAAATMADIVADEQVRGSYWKKEDGTLEAKSVKLGAKNADAQTKQGNGSAEATPPVSPKP